MRQKKIRRILLFCLGILFIPIICLADWQTNYDKAVENYDKAVSDNYPIVRPLYEEAIRYALYVLDYQTIDKEIEESAIGIIRKSRETLYKIEAEISEAKRDKTIAKYMTKEEAIESIGKPSKINYYASGKEEQWVYHYGEFPYGRSLYLYFTDGYLMNWQKQ